MLPGFWNLRLAGRCYCVGFESGGGQMVATAAATSVRKNIEVRWLMANYVYTSLRKEIRIALRGRLNRRGCSPDGIVKGLIFGNRKPRISLELTMNIFATDRHPSSTIKTLWWLICLYLIHTPTSWSPVSIYALSKPILGPFALKSKLLIIKISRRHHFTDECINHFVSKKKNKHHIEKRTHRKNIHKCIQHLKLTADT